MKDCQSQMQVEVILASRHADMPEEKPLYTIRMRYPRIIHGEVMTHRVFSRNARSSRAVPVRTMLDEVRNTPFIPWHWGKNQRGMQASEECDALVKGSLQDAYENPVMLNREQAWLEARDAAANAAESFMDAKYHKQIPNRILEPFSWIDVLATANDWGNFLWLRDHKDAEPHLQDLARMVKAGIESAKVKALHYGQWHLPYITLDDHHAATQKYGVNGGEWLRKISAARCARISYKPFDGDASYPREIERYDMLVNSDRVHASPTEHQASPDRKCTGSDKWEAAGLHGNLNGWIQFRKTIPNESH